MIYGGKHLIWLWVSCMSDEISLKGCAVISLDEYTKLKEIESSFNCDVISKTLQFMVDELIKKKATSITLKGFRLVRSEIDFSFNLYIPSEMEDEQI